MKAPQKVRVQQREHTVEGDVEFTRNADGSYGLRVTNGHLVCGEHDAEGNHVEAEEWWHRY